ncbi:MAG TPA: hypothetical protein VN764_08710, partial [Polyangiaceae bacterium]|nr:hypothetical protein [Polyangiaceae bacterium]
MKPGDHPEFFRFPAPEGRSRESSIVLNRAGQFEHEGQMVTHPGMALAFARWLRRHPDNGRFILENGYDWTYLQVEDTPYFVHSVRLSGAEAGAPQLDLTISDGSEEPLALDSVRVGADDALYCLVKGGAYEARFSRFAQEQLGPFLIELGGEVG